MVIVSWLREYCHHKSGNVNQYAYHGGYGRGQDTHTHIVGGKEPRSMLLIMSLPYSTNTCA